MWGRLGVSLGDVVNVLWIQFSPPKVRDSRYSYAEFLKMARSNSNANAMQYIDDMS